MNAQIIYYPFKGKNGILNIFNYNENHKKVELPIFFESVSAGMPSQTGDFIEAKMDLNDFKIKNPSSTFFVKVSGNSMINAGIYDKDMLIVDRSVEPKDGKVVIAVLDGDLTVKRLKINNGKIFLIAENPEYQPIEVGNESRFEIWGVVTSVIHDL